MPGAGGTDFGVPSVVTDLDRRPTDRADANRLIRLVDAAWVTLDHVTAAAPAELRKGPRGGGRDRDKMVAHVIEAEGAYAREMGITLKRQPDPTDPAAIDLMRSAMLDVLREPSDGSPLAGRGGPLAMRRAGSPGMPSTTPGRWRTGPSRLETGSVSSRFGQVDSQVDVDLSRNRRSPR